MSRRSHIRSNNARREYRDSGGEYRDYVAQGIFPSDWSLALAGELQAHLESLNEVVRHATHLAIETVILDAKQRLRAEVERAGLAKSSSQLGPGTGRKLSNAIRSLYWQDDAAALIYIQPSAVKLYDVFEDGATLKPKTGKYLVIPVPGSPAARENFGDNPRGSTKLERFKARGLELVFVPPRNGKAGLIKAVSVRTRQDKKGRTKVARAARRADGGLAKGAGEVPLFFMVPKADIDKRLNLRAEFRRTADRFMEAFAREFAKEVEKLNMMRKAA